METTTISNSVAANEQFSLSSAARRRTLIRRLLVLLVILAPVLVTVGLITLQLRANLTDFTPMWNDEISYWHQTLTYVHAGFNGGYYTVNEQPPPAAFTHFYTHGPWYPMLFGSIGKIIGWELYTPVIINLMLITAALTIFVLTVRLNTIQLVFSGLLVVTFWPALLYIPTAMQESIHQFHAIILAVVFVHVLEKRDKLPGKWQLLFALYLMIAGITRLSWAFLFLPFFVMTANPGRRGTLLALFKTVAGTAVVFVIVQQVGAPGNNSIFSVLSGFSVSIGYGLESVWLYTAKNIERLFDLTKNPLDVVQTLQVVIFVVALMVTLPFLRWRRKQTGLLTEVYFHAFNLIGIVVASLALYIIGTMGDYRVVAMHFLLSLLVLIARRRFRPVIVVVATNLAVVSVFTGVYGLYSAPKFWADRPAMGAYAEVLREHLHYDSDVPTPWCNTLLHELRDLNGPLLTGVPAGIGESFFFKPEDVTLPFRSQYLLVTDEVYQVLMQRSPSPKLALLTTLPNGRKLYRNLDANCQEGDR